MNHLYRSQTVVVSCRASGGQLEVTMGRETQQNFWYGHELVISKPWPASSPLFVPSSSSAQSPYGIASGIEKIKGGY